MASTKQNSVVFHFEKAHGPTNILHVLRVLQYVDDGVTDSQAWEQLAREQSSVDTRFDEARSLAQQLSLVETTREGIQLTHVANVLLSKRDTVQYDLLHALFYTAWKPEQPAAFGRSWFYRTFCMLLWSGQYTKLDADTRVMLAEQLTQEARTTFQKVSGFVEEKVSVSRKSLDGAQEWLSSLQPAVLQQEGKHIFAFQPRQTCSAELFLLALSQSFQYGGAEPGIDALLSTQKRNETCQRCLLNVLQFDRMLDWVQSQFPEYVSPGTRSGSYGRFVRLKQFVGVEDVLQGVAL